MTPACRAPKPGGRALLLGFALAALGSAGACRRAAPPPARPNIVVVLVDTLRADRLSLYGHERATSPRLEHFARERGVVFRSAWANAGCTFPSVNSLLTGRWPQRITERLDEHGLAIPPDLPTVAELLRADGYATAAVSASSIVRRTPSAINKQGGFDRGFDRFDESCLKRSGACITASASKELETLREPFFLYLHFLDPHSPYRPPGVAERSFSEASRAAASPWARRGEPWTIQRALYDGEKGKSFDSADVAHLSDLYDDEVRYADERFGELLDELGRRELLGRTVVAFLSDHGEELYDHGHWAHCRDLAYETVLATPLVVAAPGFAPGERRAPVSNLDLAPTLLELAGISFDPARFDGRSLVPLLGSDRAGGGPVFAAQGSVRTASDGALLLRIDLRDGRMELTARTAPGAAAAPPLDPHGAAATELRRALLAWIRQVEGEAADAVRRTDELERHLKAVGYL